LLQRRMQDITYPEDLAQSDEKRRDLLAGKNSVEFEKRYLKKDGSIAEVLLNVTRIEHPHSPHPHFFAIALDITEKRRAERAALATETEYETLFNSIDTGFCVIEMVFDEQGDAQDYFFIKTNAAFEETTGLSRSPHLSMRQQVPDHEQHWFDTYGRVARTGTPIRFEHEARQLRRWYSVYAFRTGDPALNHVGVLFEDITARKAAERRQHFFSELATALGPVRQESTLVQLITRAVGDYLQVDRCYFLECHERENRIIIGENFRRSGASNLAGEVKITDFGSLERWKGNPSGYVKIDDTATHVLTADQARIYEQINVRAYVAYPITKEDNRTHVLVVTENQPRVWTDDEISLLKEVMSRVWPLIERARSERALAAARDDLEARVLERTAKLNETINELETYSYSISHDLRAPLRAMQSYASILFSETAAKLGENEQEYLRRIITAADRMDRLIRDILLYSRVSRDAVPVQQIDLAAFIEGLVQSYGGLQANAADIAVIPPLGIATANSALLTQCLSNLLGNAIKFVAPGIRPQIRIWSERLVPGYVRLFLRDNGIGIPQEAFEKVFGIFYQQDKSREGTGIGLAVVRRAAERLGGRVGITDSSSGGTTFWLELPSPG
ncbi:MAG TPA: ATP-binding protein, partial [Opitutaceae bacterium]|nr:ATP-binding protein [Opitutaceae bacterium]